MIRDTQTLKQQVHRLLGAICVECGEDDPDMLEIDHMDDDGALERKLKARGGPAYYRRLLTPGGLHRKQLLCRNHNRKKECLRRVNGECAMPASPEKVQFRLTTQIVTHVFLEDMAETWGCPPGEVVDRIVQEYQRFDGRLRAIEETLQTLKSMSSEKCHDVSIVSNGSRVLKYGALPTPEPLKKVRWWQTSLKD